MTVLDETIVPSESDTEEAKVFSRLLAKDFDRTTTVTLQKEGNGTAIEVPSQVFDVLVKVLHVMSQGKAFSLIPVDKELTTQQAADILNVSRPYLNKILDLGEIQHRKVGRNRRIKYNDLISYKNAQDEQSRQALQSLADEAQKLDMEY